MIDPTVFDKHLEAAGLLKPAVDITIDKVNEAYVKLSLSADGIGQELSDKFTFEAANAKFHPKRRAGVWDGKIRLFDRRTKKILAGLTHDIVKYAHDNGYTVQDNTGISVEHPFSLNEAKEIIQLMQLPSHIVPHDYQIRAFALAIRNRRCVLVSPTGSGKSLIAYLIKTYFAHKNMLIVVPTISLVEQMASDFADYGYGPYIHKLKGGVDPDSSAQVTVTTWQSAYTQPVKWFDKFDIIIGDEAHNFKAKSLSELMGKAERIPYRIGMTGTLDGAEVNEMVLKGLFGPVEQVATTEELIKRETLAALNIKVLTLKHRKDLTMGVDLSEYSKEIDYLIQCEPRNRFIRNLACSLKGNTLILYRNISHGLYLVGTIRNKRREVLSDIHPTLGPVMKSDVSDHANVYLINGQVEAEIREEVRAIAEKSDDAIIVASYGVFSTGVNIKRLHNIIFASPSKSRVRVLQSIGRGLRKGEDKDSCTLFDIADALDVGRGKRNFTLNHMIERIKMYSIEGFPYEMHTIEIRGRNGSGTLF